MRKNGIGKFKRYEYLVKKAFTIFRLSEKNREYFVREGRMYINEIHKFYKVSYFRKGKRSSYFDYEIEGSDQSLITHSLINYGYIKLAKMMNQMPMPNL